MKISNKEASRARIPDYLDESSLQTVIGYCMRRADLALNQWYDHYVRRPTRLRQVEFAILHLVGDNDNVTQTQLSRSLGVPASNLKLVIDSLEKRGLLLRRKNRDDGRSFWIELTRKGVGLLQEARVGAAAMEAGLQKGWTRKEVRTLIELLARLRAARPPSPAATGRRRSSA